jgi:hypothetical protein
MDVNFAVDTRFLGIAQDQVTQSPTFEPKHGNSSVFHLDVGMVQVIPVAEQFVNWSHQPLEYVQLVRALVD